MGLYKRKFNPIPNTSLVPTNTAIRVRDTVSTYANLPLSGNVIGDGRVTTDTGHLYLWSIDSSTGLLTDWLDQGNFVDVDWAAISNKPSSSVSDIDDAVSKKHSNSLDHVQGTDSYSASQILNDSDVTGTNVDNALESLLELLNTLQGDSIKETAYKIDFLTGDVVLTDTSPGSLQTAITALTDGQILEIKTNAAYTPIQIPSGKSFTIKNSFGYAPSISGQNAIKLLNGAADVTIAGLILSGNTTGDSNGKGACIAFDHLAKVNNILFYNISMREVGSASAIVLSYHQSISGDNYSTAPTLSEMSEDISFINCHFSRACKDGTEGGCITVRGINRFYVADCDIDNQNLSGRGVQVQDCINVLIEDNDILNIGGSNAEAIKFDEIGTMSGYRITGIARRNRISGCIEGIDVDDKADILVMDNICLNCIDEGISVDDSALAILIHNTCYNNKYGIRLESGAITNLKNNICFNNTTANYQIENGYTLDNSNSTSRADALKIPIADNIPFNTTTVKLALEDLDSSKQDSLGFTPEDVSNKSDDETLGGATPSITLYPTQAAVKEYVDNLSIYLENTQLDPNTLEYVALPPDNYAKLLLHGNGVDESTTIIDAVGHTVFTYGTTQLDTSEKKFGTASIQFNKNKEGLDRTDYAYVDMGTDSDLGTEDFTIDLWIKMNAYGQYGNNPFISHDYQYWNTGIHRGVSWGFMFQQYGSTGPGRLVMMRKYASNDPASEGRYSNDITLDLNTWYHVAVVRDGNTLRFFVNGIQQGTANCSGITYDRFSENTEPVYLGRCSGGSVGELPLNFDGWMDELRVSKGIARWKENFTPSTTEYGLFLDSYIKVILDTDETLSANSDVTVASQKAIKSYVDALCGASLVSELKDISLNLMLNAFRIAQVGSLTIFNMVKGFVDEYEDESGIDVVNSIYQLYNSSYDYYTPNVETVDSYTKLLLHCDGTDGEQIFTDSSQTPKTVTPIGDAVVLDSAQQKFGTTSGLFSGERGVVNGCLELDSSSDFSFGSGEFTLDFWVRWAVLPTGDPQVFLSRWDSSYGLRSWELFIDDGVLVFRISTDGYSGTLVDYPSEALSLSVDTWYHIAIVRDVNTLRFFVNGIAKGTGDMTGKTLYANSSLLWVGSGGGDGRWYFSNCWLDEIRISKGIARWTTEFTPPIALYGNIQNMTLLSNVQVATIIPTDARIIIFEEDGDSITLNTDIKAYISRDNGVTFTQVTLEDEGNYVTGARILSGSVDLSSQPSGSNMKYKIETLNNKELNIHGTAISWK